MQLPLMRPKVSSKGRGGQGLQDPLGRPGFPILNTCPVEWAADDADGIRAEAGEAVRAAPAGWAGPGSVIKVPHCHQVRPTVACVRIIVRVCVFARGGGGGTGVYEPCFFCVKMR